MANLKNSTSVATDDGLKRVQLNFYRYATQEGNLSYIHIKTSLARYSNVMYMIEAEGYNYGTWRAIRCAWSGYLYNEPSTTIHNPVQFTSAYDGITAHGQYISTDGYLVIRANSSQNYFCGFNLSAYQTSPGVPIAQVSVLSTALNNYAGASF